MTRPLKTECDSTRDPSTKDEGFQLITRLELVSKRHQRMNAAVPEVARRHSGAECDASVEEMFDNLPV